MVRLGGLGSILAHMYTDSMTIYRHDTTPDRNPDGSIKMALEGTPVASGVSCRISFSRPDPPQQLTESANPLYLPIKIFCGHGVDVKKGDKLVVSRLNDDGSVMDTYTGIANKPAVYPSHQEIEMVEVGDA